MSPRHKFAHNFFTSSPGIEHLSLLTALCKFLTTTDQLYNLNLCVSVYGCMQIVVTVCDVGLKLSWNDDSVAYYSTLDKLKPILTEIITVVGYFKWFIGFMNLCI